MGTAVSPAVLAITHYRLQYAASSLQDDTVRQLKASWSIPKLLFWFADSFSGNILCFLRLKIFYGKYRQCKLPVLCSYE